MIFLYGLFLIGITVWSYGLIDINLTLFNNHYWEVFRQWIIQLGYFNRQTNVYVYIGIIIGLFAFYWYFYKYGKKTNPLLVGFIVGSILLFAYPALSHDLFNYIFYAKIVTTYHQNPYFLTPEHFRGDPWLRFMHWTHRTYPYGPTFILFTLIPSFLAMGKFILNYFLFKLLFISSYWLAIFFLNKKNKHWAMIFATQPLILMEGLVNSHNDLIGLSLAVVGVCLLLDNYNTLFSRLILIFSAGIKYITFPLVFVQTKNTKLNNLVFLSFIGPLFYLSFTREIHPWYFLSIFAFLPFFTKIILDFSIFFFGLLISNISFIHFGVMNIEDQLIEKNIILLVFFMLNAWFLFVKYYIFKKSSEFNKLVAYGLIILLAAISHLFMLLKTVPFSSLQIQQLLLSDIKLTIYIVPVLFIISIGLFLCIRRIPFILKIGISILLISLDYFLVHTRLFSVEYVVIFPIIICVEIFLIVVSYKKPRFITSYRINPVLQFGVFFIIFLTASVGLFHYFSTDFGIKTLYYQKAIADAIDEHKHTWEYNKIQNKKEYDKTNLISIKVFPKEQNISGISYLLKKDHNLQVRDRGLTYIICYDLVCKQKFYMDGILKRGDLFPPEENKISFDEIFTIYEVPGKVEVFGYR